MLPVIYTYDLQVHMGTKLLSSVSRFLDNNPDSQAQTVSYWQVSAELIYSSITGFVKLTERSQ